MKQLLVLIFTVLPLTLSTVQAKVYKIVDENGRVTFTDRPQAAQQESSTPVPISPTNVQPAVNIEPVPIDANPAQEPEFKGYSSVSIDAPSHDSTVPPGQLDVTIKVSSNPELQPGHLVRIIYDNKPAAAPSSNMSLTIDQLERGSHQIQAQILSDSGKVIARSRTIEIHVKRGTAPQKQPRRVLTP
jgi:hypothetical protein